MRHTVRLTTSFTTNLDGIKVFLEQQGEPRAFKKLVVHLFDELIPNLEAFPHMGRDFLNQPIRSVAARTKLRKLKAALGKNTELREYIADDYLILYAIRTTHIYLLAIRHHHQLSFDLMSHWA